MQDDTPRGLVGRLSAAWRDVTTSSWQAEAEAIDAELRRDAEVAERVRRETEAAKKREEAATRTAQRAADVAERALEVDRQTRERERRQVHSGVLGVDEAGGLVVDLDHIERPLFRDIPRDGRGRPLAMPVDVQRDGHVLGDSVHGGAPALRSIRVRARRDAAEELSAPMSPDRMAEMGGIVGTYHSGGVPLVEHAPDLYPYQARGYSTEPGELRKMEREPVAGGALRFLVNLLMRGSYYFAPPPVPESARRWLQLDDGELERMADYVSAELFGNPDVNASRMLREQFRTMNVEGPALHEFAIDTARAANGPGLTLKGVEYREPGSVDAWVYHHERLVGFTQFEGLRVSHDRVPESSAVDIRKCIHSTLGDVGNNPEGVPRMRLPYRLQRVKAEIIALQLQNFRRFGFGFPVFRESDTSIGGRDKDRQVSIRKAATGFYAHQNAYMSLPVGLDLDLIENDAKQIAIEMGRYCDEQTREAFGVRFLEHGTSGTGSFALHSHATQMFLAQLQGDVRALREGCQRLARALVDARFGPQAVYPVLVVDNLLSASPADIAEMWSRNQAIEIAGTYTLDEDNTRREAMGLPMRAIDEDAGDRQEGAEGGDAEGEAQPLPEPLAPAEDAGLSLNGAQIVAALDTIGRLGAGLITAETAKVLLMGIGFDEASAGIVVDAETRREPTEAEKAASTEEGAQDVLRALLARSSRRLFDALVRVSPDMRHQRLREIEEEVGGGCGCGKPHRRKQARRHVVVGRDGKEWRCHRQLEGEEVHVAWRSLSETLDRVESSTAEQLAADGADQRRAFLDAYLPIRDAFDAGQIGLAEALLKVERIEADCIACYEETAASALRQLAAEVEADMLAELRSQYGGDFDAVRQELDSLVDPSAIVLTQALAVARRVSDEFETMLRQAARLELQGGARTELKAMRPNVSFIESALREPVSLVLNKVREWTAIVLGPEVELAKPTVRYSAVMDGDTCGDVGDGSKRCADMDGKRMSWDSQLRIAVRPPNPYCDSAKNRTRGNKCRCIETYEVQRPDA